MESKADLLARCTPRALLLAETVEAARALSVPWVPGVVPILCFPFRVGRESRVKVIDGQLRRIERPRLGIEKPNNDLYLLDDDEPRHLSREHFAIDRGDDGYLLIDRGSACGVGVGELRIGGRDKGGVAKLSDGQEIAIGTSETRYRYRFIAFE